MEDHPARRAHRSLTKAPTFRAEGPGIALRGAKVELHRRLRGTMTVHYEDRVRPVIACRADAVRDPAEDMEHARPVPD